MSHFLRRIDIPETSVRTHFEIDPREAPMPNLTTAELAAAIAAFELPTLSDCAGDQARLVPTLRPIRPGMRLAGPAYTVEGAAGDNLAMHQALFHCPAGHVLVATVQGGNETGHWGEIMAVAAREKGLLGLVIDGAVRDPGAIAAVPFPVFSAGVNPRKSRRALPGRLNVPIHCAGVAVKPGEMVVGDEHGVLVLPMESVPGVLAAARKALEREQGIIDRLKRGETLAAILGLDLG